MERRNMCAPSCKLQFIVPKQKNVVKVVELSRAARFFRTLDTNGTRAGKLSFFMFPVDLRLLSLNHFGFGQARLHWRTAFG